MTKQQLQKELLEKVKPGTKPSQLKRSRSLGDISQPSPLPKTPLTKSKSAQELEPVNSSLEQLETQISVLELKLETCQRELTELNSLTAENTQLKKELAELKKQLSQTQKDLEASLEARHQNLKG